MRINHLLLSCSLLISIPLQAQQPVPAHNTDQSQNRSVFEQQLAISSELMVLVNESPLEPRSVGSYTVKTYAVSKPEFPFDRFIAGVVRPRDGTIEMIKTVDINLDGDKELVVIIRNAGSGSYLSAEAFDISRTGLELLASVSGLASNANPVSALTEKMRSRQQ